MNGKKSNSGSEGVDRAGRERDRQRERRQATMTGRSGDTESGSGDRGKFKDDHEARRLF